ncbi:hydroxypyruvate isomerase [Amphritea balenae]|uniref:Hydroxypyruvate isomerase n=1 Tax=Amphritea balenae TaxID=452629 RepID=A0A3P1SLG1_9GAMM|nr:hydroxypyruvate isomerase [Amphritea balenae]RRC97966.1 hydroxypyruvate isomerase [Amphritea balenae]GGK82147.1 hydroxypyruvate isomerase [Amphritea balenae]
MPDFAVNLSMLFTELPFVERFSAAAAAGFKKVEVQFPYELPIEQISAELEKNCQQLVLLNAPAGNWAGGERGIACHPDRSEEFRQGLDRAICYAAGLKCKQINILSGISPVNYSHEEIEPTFINNLRYAAEKLESAGIQLLAEAINTQDIPGFFLNNSQQAFILFDQVGHPNLKLQYDIYHMQIMEGNLITTLQNNLDRIGHIQFADVPGRHEPQTGELNFSNIFQALDDMGYSGLTSLEYTPASSSLESLNWMKHRESDG